MLKREFNHILKYTHIGTNRVENFLDCLHTIRFQTERNGLKRESRKDLKKKYINLINNSDMTKEEIRRSQCRQKDYRARQRSFSIFNRKWKSF